MAFSISEPAADPIDVFVRAWQRARTSAPPGFDWAQVALATAGADGRPSVRVVLLRGVDGDGFSFYTNYRSRKGRELESNPYASLCFYWHWLDEQVRIEGPVLRTSAADSDAYFASRPRGSQIGAWASDQSEPIASRAELESRYRDLDAAHMGREVPRPPHWGGYRLGAERVEFWKAGEYRLHDRLLYTRSELGWDVQRLFP